MLLLLYTLMAADTHPMLQAARSQDKPIELKSYLEELIKENPRKGKGDSFLMKALDCTDDKSMSAALSKVPDYLFLKPGVPDRIVDKAYPVLSEETINELKDRFNKIIDSEIAHIKREFLDRTNVEKEYQDNDGAKMTFTLDRWLEERKEIGLRKIVKLEEIRNIYLQQHHTAPEGDGGGSAGGGAAESDSTPSVGQN